MTDVTKPAVTREITRRSTADVEFNNSELDIALIDGIEHGGTVILRPILTVAIDRTTGQSAVSASLNFQSRRLRTASAI